MVRYSEVRKLRKTSKASIYLEICREIGLVLTWLVLNLIPGVTANAVTLGMLFLNIVCAFLLYSAVLLNSVWLLVLTAVLFNLSICLDCVDGNVARFKKQQSLLGVFLDRVVHNVSYPLLFFAAGVAMLNRTGNTCAFLALFCAGLFSELSPIEVALESLKGKLNSQMSGYSLQRMGTGGQAPATGFESSGKGILWLLVMIHKLFPFWNKLFIALLLDVSLLTGYWFSSIFAILYLAKQLFSQVRLARKTILAMERSVAPDA